MSPTLVLLVLAGSPVDDGSVHESGAPRLMSGHPTVRMLAEHVHIRIGRRSQSADCWFAFNNEGPACEVRMGFPDFGYGAFQTEFELEKYLAKKRGEPAPVFCALENFRSWVDGVEAKVSLVPDPDETGSWHTKRVRFEKGPTRYVKVSYVSLLSGGAAKSVPYISEANYLMFSGASWKGPIGQADVVFEFKDGWPEGRLNLVALPKDVR